MKEQHWFEDWFNSPYYHLLYKHRNHFEAEMFIDNLLNYFQPPHGSRFLDLGCGKGRHAVYLNKKNYDVTGIDLSEENIACAKHLQNNHLHFFVQDMRKLFKENSFDYVLNLFTSFGYFEKEEEDMAVITVVGKELKMNGTFVLDFFNSEKIIRTMVKEETKEVEGIKFTIHKRIENNFIVKQISFTDNSSEHHFQERVKLVSLSDFEKYFQANKLKIVDLFGNYQLEKFDKVNSDRLILIAKKEE